MKGIRAIMKETPQRSLALPTVCDHSEKRAIHQEAGPHQIPNLPVP